VDILNGVTEKVRDNSSGNSEPSEFSGFNGKLYFSADDGVNGVELWETDGTALGTKLFKIINSSGNSSPKLFTKCGTHLYFTAEESSFNRELYETDGTAAGTKVISPTNVDYGGPCRNTEDLHCFNNTLYFFAKYIHPGMKLYKVEDPSLFVAQEKESVEFNVYPNPLIDKVTITTAESTSFTLLDMRGKELQSFEVDQAKEISLAKYAGGIYFLRENSSGTQTKIVKQ